MWSQTSAHWQGIGVATRYVCVVKHKHSAGYPVPKTTRQSGVLVLDDTPNSITP